MSNDLGRNPKKHPPARCIAPEYWLSEAIFSGRTIQAVWTEQLNAHCAGMKRAIRDIARFVTEQFWDGKCVYCGQLLTRGWSWEHFQPQSLGGDDAPANCLPACPQCNSARGSSDPWQFLRDQGRDEAEIATLQQKLATWRAMAAESRAVPLKTKLETLRRLGDIGVFNRSKDQYGYDPCK